VTAGPQASRKLRKRQERRKCADEEEKFEERENVGQVDYAQ